MSRSVKIPLKAGHAFLPARIEASKAESGRITPSPRSKLGAPTIALRPFWPWHIAQLVPYNLRPLLMSPAWDAEQASSSANAAHTIFKKYENGFIWLFQILF
jgi:hypothetical protein